MKTVKVQMRWFIKADMREVLEMERACFRCPWTRDDFLAVAKPSNVMFLVAEAHKQLVGYVIYELQEDSLRVLNLAVDPEWQREGVGWRMLERLKGRLAIGNRKFILADVCEYNLDAQLFFSYCGFRAIGVVADCFDDGSAAYRFRYSLSTPTTKNRLAEYF